MECSGATEVKKETPIETALNHLKNSLGRTKEVVSKFESILSLVVTQPEPAVQTTEAEKSTPQTSLETRLLSMNGDVCELETYLLSLQNRIQL